MYVRYTLYAFLVYLVARNTRLRKSHGVLLRRVLVVLFVTQLAAATFKVLVMVDRTEWRVGTMTVAGGIVATTFPMLALGGCIGHYLYRRQSYAVLILGFSFGIIGFASGKRAVYFALPAFFAVSIIVARVIAGVRIRWTRLSVHMLGAALCLLPGLYYGIVNSDFGNAARTSTGLGEALEAATRFAGDYETASSDGAIIGRRPRLFVCWRTLLPRHLT
jgi:hypothetical protein